VHKRQPADLVSLVLPAYNEEPNIRPIYDSIQRALGALEHLEIIFVDDGSSDGTAQCVRQLRLEDCSVRLVRFGRNFGHQAALFAGLQAAQGAAVITLDCDLQHPPELITRMLEAWRSGAVDYLLLDRTVVEDVLRFKDRQPFLRGLVAWLGFTPVRFEYVAPPRSAGKSSYSLAKKLRRAVHAITGLSSKPLRFSFYLGCFTALVCLAYIVFAVVQFAIGRTIQGWTSVIVMVMFLGAVQLVSVAEQTRGMPRSVIVECDEPAAVNQDLEHAPFGKNPA